VKAHWLNPIRDSSSKFVATVRTVEPNHDGRLGGPTDLYMSAQRVEIGEDTVRVWMLDVDRLQREPRRGCGCWVLCLAPADEKRDYPR